MAISFQQPLFLFLFIPAVALILWWWRSRHKAGAGGSKRHWIAGIRLLFFSCLILSLSGILLLFPVRGETVVFVVDRSASMNDDGRIVPFLRDAVQAKKPEDSFGIVSVGGEAGVEQPVKDSRQLTTLGVPVNPHATNLAEGIRLATGMIPSQARGRIVVLTDGLETRGDAAAEARLAKERGIVTDAVYLPQRAGDEVMITSLQLPDRLFIGEAFQGKVTVNSTTATRGMLRFYEGNREAGQQSVAIEKGENRFVFDGKAAAEGFHRYRAELTADKDTIRVNNEAYAFTRVSGSPKILIVQGHDGAADNLVHALQAGGLNVELKNPAMLPRELNDYKGYASLVFAHVQATQISDIDMGRIRTAVRDLGMGFVMTGGPDSFGMGGWFKTPIEEALPVEMDLKGKEELPSLGLTLVIDKSGSMASGMGGPNKMELAKEAANRATEMLNSKDQVSVVAFDSTPWTVVEPTPVTKLSDIQEKIGSIYADGGTEIFSALEVAYEKAQEMKTQRKHVILLTDGQSSQQSDYESLLEEMKQKNITVSTVAVGGDADTALLEQIAQFGKGRYYQSNDASSIPKIFSKETALSTRTFIVEKPHVPKHPAAHDWSVLNQPIPLLHTYIATTPKQTAELALVSADSDPVLARWQYGLGRTVAWTSDLEGKWAPGWAAWNMSSRLWSDIISWTFPQISHAGWETETGVDGTRATVKVQLPPNSPLPQSMEAVILDNELKRQVIRLQPTAPGKLQGEFAADRPGTYMLQIVQKEGDKITASQTEGLTLSYSPEYGIRSGGEQKAAAMVKAGGGKLLEKPKASFAGDLPGKWDRQDISDLLLMVAALLWPLDIALRRVQVPASWIQRMKAKLPFSAREQAPSSERAAALGTLAAKKEQYKEKAPAPQTRPAPVKLREPLIAKQKKAANSGDNPAARGATFNRLLEAKKNHRKEE
ncbi:VWA domain-containing protein [Aneurinibacillus tyrosinisolvens]|uniref:VWA domain-containing protein n=1 Tax=Aneurinibacillus tyrosinisolvens TaxID=1443435 RepID=UPI00063F7C4B|nr:VWA domain-containing protein [Aneurinibacillus tyrosinisolvens]